MKAVLENAPMCCSRVHAVRLITGSHRSRTVISTLSMRMHNLTF
jgi:hypothetical protein